MTRYVWHVALGSGDATAEPCGYGAAQLGAWRGHVEEALAAKDGQPIPGQPGYAMSARAIGGVLLCTVGRTGDTTALVSFCVVGRAKQAHKAWQAFHEGYPQFAASAGKTPQTPFCAVRAEAGLAYDRAAASWLDGYQLAVAWAWIGKEGRNGNG